MPQEIFKRADLDNDGRLSHREFDQVVYERVKELGDEAYSYYAFLDWVSLRKPE